MLVNWRHARSDMVSRWEHVPRMMIQISDSRTLKLLLPSQCHIFEKIMANNSRPAIIHNTAILYIIVKDWVMISSIPCIYHQRLSMGHENIWPSYHFLCTVGSWQCRIDPACPRNQTLCCETCTQLGDLGTAYTLYLHYGHEKLIYVWTYSNTLSTAIFMHEA